MAFRELDIDGLYEVLEKELGADIATVIRDEDLCGKDFLGLTEAEVASMFSKMGHKKKVLRLITEKNAPTTESQGNGTQAKAQTMPTSASHTPPTNLPDVGTADLQQPGGNTSTFSVQVTSPSSPPATMYSTGNVDGEENIEEMAKNLDNLNKDQLFLLLSKKIDEDAAKAVRDSKLSGAGLIELTEKELLDVLPLIGHRKDVKNVIATFKKSVPAQQKVAAYMEQSGSTRASASLLSATEEDPLLNPATTQNEMQLAPSAGLGSQTKPKEQGHRHEIPKAVVPPLPPHQRLALRVKEESVCIRKGRQSIYLLKLKHVAEAKGVAKYRYGKLRPESQEYVVMLVGATGAGKTTLINGIANYILGVEWEDDFRFKLIAEEGSGSQAHSQTSSITAYTITCQKDSPFPHTLTLVDTPGFGDTKGLDSDKRIVELIRAFFSMPGQKGIDHIHAIGFVTQASLARLTHTQRYVFDSILSVFGVDIGKNILMMTTFADGKKPPVLEAVDEAGIGYCRSFKFNNSALFTEEPSNSHDQEVEVVSFDKMFWDMGMISFKSFFTQLSSMQDRSLQLTKEVLAERKQLEAIIQSLQLRIQAILGKISSLQQEEQIMEQHKAHIAANRNFNYTVTEQKIVKRETRPGQYVTNCVKCNFTCHQNCAYANDDEKKHCCAMSGENCTVCSKNCHWTSHVNNPFWFETETVTVKKTYDDLKKRYEAAMTGKTTKESVVGMIRAEIAASYHEVNLMTRRAQQILQRLDDIALRPNPLSEVEYIDLLIQSEQSECRDGFMQRIECLRTVRKQAELLSNVKDGVVFEGESLKLAGQLAQAEADKVGWFRKAAKSTWNAITELADQFRSGP